MTPRNTQHLGLIASLAGMAALLTGGGCARKTEQAPESDSCPAPLTGTDTGSGGAAYAFNPDPIVASGDANLSPLSLRLDSYRSLVSLEHLGGQGVLEGSYVDVRDGKGCGEGFSALSDQNQFLYSHGDGRFQDAMTYYFGDNYRSALDGTGYLQPKTPVRMIAHCGDQDNAYFERGADQDGSVLNLVCLGDSVATPGASYADDASVSVHELQHATTVNTYSQTQELGNLWYDEGGALNEGISDFMALAFLEPRTPQSFDKMLFSRWALGMLVPGERSTRGGHRCPEYSGSYPACGDFPSFAVDSGTTPGSHVNTISYVYPDGLGWPHADNYAGLGKARSAFMNFTAQEEIHNAGTLATGALWDIYEALRSNHGDSETAFQLSAKVAMEALKHLSRPSSTQVAPVTFREFASQLVSSASLLGFSSADRSSITAALTERGLYGGTLVPSGWAAVGDGVDAPGLRIEDDPVQLRDWLLETGMEAEGDDSIVKQSSVTANGHLDPGEVVAIWFDVKNTSAVTAGGIILTVTSNNPYVTFVGGGYNFGYLSSTKAQISYSKINGTDIVAALHSASNTYNVPTGNSYFLTNPYFDGSLRTALLVKVSASIPSSQKNVTFTVSLTPSNGAADSVDFPVTVD